jgi:hypothetical protein
MTGFGPAGVVFRDEAQRLEDRLLGESPTRHQEAVHD